MEEKGLRSDARTLAMGQADMAGGAVQHSLQIVNREQVMVHGVLAVDSFDDEEIVLETEMGTLTLRGEDLHIKQLDLELGRFAVEGFVSVCTYSTPRQRGARNTKAKGFLERLLR